VAFAIYLLFLVPAAAAWGLPRRAAGVTMGALVLTPLLLGALLYRGWRAHRRLSLEGVVLYRARLPAARLVLIVVALLAWAIVALAAASDVDAWLLEHVFHSYPAQPDNDTGAYPRGITLATRVASLVVVGLLVPVAEELYFRGYLLPRVAWMGLWAVPWTAVLFTLQHYHSPWQSATRLLVLLPMIYAVQRTRSVAVGIGVHATGNTVGEVQMLVEALAGPSG
jgi:membrane protease YdiL (CAAX protease family)